jgi:hypothetical protein
MGRLFVIPARDESVAVVLRRGPAKWYHLILWDTRRDTFTHGAWIKGRIYEHSCDLSPDGQLFVYSVLQGSRAGTKFTHAWTAISRPPWLFALVLWPQGTTYFGGGKFTAARSLWGKTSAGTHPEFPFPRGRLEIANQPPPAPQERPSVEDADWAGYDHRGNVVYSKGDLLFRRTKSEDIPIADFSELTPNPQPAPEWAKRPL